MAASLAFIAMMMFSVAVVAGFFGALHPAFDSFSHFRVHLAVLIFGIIVMVGHNHIL